MNGIVDGIVAELLSALCKCELAFACARFSCNAEFKVLLGGVGYNFAEELCKLGCMLCLFKCITLVSFCNFGIALSFSNSCHGKVHTYFGAFTGEVCTKTFHNFLVLYNAVAYVMLASKLGCIGLLNGNKRLGAAYGANFYVIGYYFAANSTSFHDL